LQGYVENDFPELATIDNIAGKMEGVVRNMNTCIINK